MQVEPLTSMQSKWHKRIVKIKVGFSSLKVTKQTIEI